MDIVDKETRSRMMSAVRDKNTKLELEMRRRLFSRGFRFRLHRKDLPGTPDMIFPRYSAVMFVHGCFWHYHGCHLSQIPQTRREWWKDKLEGNRRRDKKVIRELRQLGWRVLIIWECSFRRPGTPRAAALDKIADRAAKFLKSEKPMLEMPGSPRKGSVRSKRRGVMHG